MREINAILGSCKVQVTVSPSWEQSGGLRVLLFGLDSAGFGRSCFCTVLRNISCSATEKTKLIVHVALTFLRSQLAIFAKFWKCVRGRFLLSEVLPLFCVNQSCFWTVTRCARMGVGFWVRFAIGFGTEGPGLPVFMGNLGFAFQ